MNFLVNRDQILEVISKVRHYAEKDGKGHFAWSSCVKITAAAKELFLEVFTLEAPTVIFRLDVGVDIKQQGFVVVQCKTVNDVLSSMPPQSVINFSIKDNNLKIQQSRRVISLPIMSTEFPAAKDLSGLVFKKMPHICKKVNSVLYATKEDETRVVTGCVHIHNGFVVGTDGHRLAYVTTGDCDIQDCLIPAKVFGKISKVFNKEEQEAVEVASDDSCLYLRSGNGIVGIRRVARDYLRWQTLLPNISLTKCLTFNKDSMKDALRAVSIASNSESKGVVFKFSKDGNVKIFAKSNESHLAAEEVIDYTGDLIDFDYSINSDYLIDLLNNLELGEATMRVISSNEKTIFIEGDTTQLIMPLKL